MGVASGSPLLESAQEFLTEALRNLRDGRLNFAIVHAVTAVELTLKAQLARQNPALIMRDIDTRKPQDSHTVTLGNLPQRMSNLGMPLDHEQAQLVREIAGWRNQIIHHMPEFDGHAAKQQLPKLLDFLASYMRTEMGVALEDFLPPDMYRDASNLLSDWRNAIEAARDLASQEGRVVVRGVCPVCTGVEVMCRRDEDRAYCHLCKTDLYVIDHCAECGAETLVSYAPQSRDFICDDCVDAAGDEYASMYGDLLCGK